MVKAGYVAKQHGDLNDMTKKAYATIVLSLPEIILQLRVPVGPSLHQPSKTQQTFISSERMSSFVQLFESLLNQRMTGEGMPVLLWTGGVCF